MQKELNQWVATRIARDGPVLVAFVLAAFSILVAACGGGRGGGSSY